MVPAPLWIGSLLWIILQGMAEPAVSRAKAALGGAEVFNHIILVETTATDLSPLHHRLSGRNVNVEPGHDLRQACRIVAEGSHGLVVAGPRLQALSFGGVAGSASHPVVKLHSLLSELTPLSQARDAKKLLTCLVQTAATLTEPHQTFALLCDRVTGVPDLGSLCKHPACPAHLAGTLGRYLDALPSPGAGDTGPWLWMVPLIHDSRLEALLGLVSWEEAEEPAARSLAMLRFFSLISAPFLAALRDVEQLRRTTDELEAVLEIKSHLMSNVCHEFRSLLAAVRGYSKRIIEGRTGAITDVQRDALTVVLRNTNKLLDLVSHSLPFVVEQQLSVESFDLREAWQGALQRMRRQLSEKSIRIREQIPDESFTVTADKGRLAVVFEIVLANAIQCAAPAGEITVQLLRGANGEVTVKLLVAGAGLPPHTLDKIFDHRGEPAPAASHPDERRITGLALVHDMVWLHGGRIAVMSSEGEGTVFIFTLPPPKPGQQSSRD